ncbi:AraC family transcriptional regulator [Kineosporia rhizophila]|uniref:AraC family transcriptional regulator n=1 Tax=Kineosporia TaxID=49184 RepID=UPI001E2CC4E7|nr:MULTISPECIES: AraC family transcriptional regulator [Kineosporia]MCE0538852.1 AraC family transcriptional regulator [Kineosporia rhizophila]GLY18770.1 AraC family transcriptional regulator [Kineosporia sp. NBRC 101677]
MDGMSALLDGPRAREAFLLRSTLTAPWSMKIADEAALTLCSVVSGRGCVMPAEGGVRWLGPGDVSLFKGPRPYVVADDPATPPQAIVLPGQVCVTPDGLPVLISTLGTRSWGNDPNGETVIVTGSYQLPGETSRRLLDALPELIVLTGEEWGSPLPALLNEEIVKDEPGQSAMLDRLLDLTLISALRAWFARADGAAPGWYLAYGDPVVGPALRLMQDEVARPWTVDSLAAEVGVSRAGLARRFRELVGEPPMTFLTSWRLDLAADLLRSPDMTLSAVARQVGYSTPFALSAAFKRVRGMSPSEYRVSA